MIYKNNFIGLFLLTLTIIISSCEKDVKLDLPQPEQKIVVEGHIEQDAPPYVILTWNTSLYEEIDANTLQSLFVKGAIVTVSDGTTTDTLQEISTNSLTPELIAQFLNMDPDDIRNTSISFYSTLNMFGEVGKRYELTVQKDNHLVKAVTTIPQLIPLDSVYTRPHPDPGIDSLVRLFVLYDDPDTLGNFARYFIQRNGGGMITGYIFDDALINGKQFEFELPRPLGRNEDFDYETSGYYWKGDTVVVKWTAIDQDHYQFWETWEYALGSAGNPFSGPSYVKSNVNGGLGIWGGYGVTYDTLIIQK